VTRRRALIPFLVLAVAMAVVAYPFVRDRLEVDRRLDLLRADPVLDLEPDGAVLVSEWENPQGRLPIVGEVHFFGDWGKHRVGRRFEVADPREFARQVAVAAIEAGWTIRHNEWEVACRDGERFEVDGHRVVDGLILRLEVDAHPSYGGDEGWDGAITLQVASGEDPEGVSRAGPVLGPDDVDGTCLGDED
jgi:hypothetical protein